MEDHLWDLEEKIIGLKERASRLRADGKHGEAHEFETLARELDEELDQELQALEV